MCLGVKANPFFVEMATPQKAAGKEMFHENYDMLHFGQRFKPQSHSKIELSNPSSNCNHMDEQEKKSMNRQQQHRRF